MTTTKDEAIKTFTDALEKISDLANVHDLRLIRRIANAALAATSHIAPDAAAIQAEGDIPRYSPSSMGGVAAMMSNPKGSYVLLSDVLKASPAIAPDASELPPLPAMGPSRYHMYSAAQMDEHARAAITMHRAAAAKPSELTTRLREYAAEPGYSHNDYADTMRQAADEIDRLAAAEPVPTSDAHRWISEVRDQILYPLANQEGELGRVAESFGVASVGILATKPAASEAAGELAHLPDDDVAQVLASVGIDTEKSAYAWNPVLQFRASVRMVHDIAVAYLAAIPTARTVAPIAASEAVGERDMAVAQAVRQACCACAEERRFTDELCEAMGDLNLSSIIKSLAAPAAPTDAKPLPENWQVREAVNCKRGTTANLISDAAVGEIMDAVRALKSSPQAPKTEGEAT